MWENLLFCYNVTAGGIFHQKGTKMKMFMTVLASPLSVLHTTIPRKKNLRCLELRENKGPKTPKAQSYRATLYLDHGRSCFAHAPTTVQTATRSLVRFRPPTFDKVEVHKTQQHGQAKTQHCLHNGKGSAELGRVVVDTRHNLYSVYTGTVEGSLICYVPHARRTQIR